MTDQLAISLKEAAHRLGGVSLSFIYDEITRGNLTTVKLGKRRLVRTADLEAYLASRRETRVPEIEGVDALWDHAESGCSKCGPIAAIGAKHGVVFVNPACAEAKKLAANVLLEAGDKGLMGEYRK